MKNKTHKLVIVGAGPIGGYLAQLLKKGGIESLLIEEHKELGRPIHCAGLVGKKVFEESRIPLPSSCILNTINGAVIHLGKDSLQIRRKEVAYVVNREHFDKYLGKDLHVLYETKFLGLENNKHHYVIETDKGEVSAEIVIGADGANSAVRNFVQPPDSTHYMRGVQFRMQYKPAHTDLVEVYIRRPYFYWIIPEGNGTVRVGVISQNPYQDLLEFIKEKKMGDAIVEKFAGIVPLNHFNTLSHEKIFLVGDSASQVKPLSYGGIYMGMRGAELLAHCLIEKKYSEYSKLWAEKFGKEISMMLRAREIFYKIPDHDINKIFTFIKKRTDIIEKRGDFENHSLLLWEFLKHPGISKEVLQILLKIIKISLVSES